MKEKEISIQSPSSDGNAQAPLRKLLDDSIYKFISCNHKDVSIIIANRQTLDDLVVEFGVAGVFKWTSLSFYCGYETISSPEVPVGCFKVY